VFSNDQISIFFEATTQAVEEAIVNALLAAETMEGINGNKADALPHHLLSVVLKKYNRLEK
jgi:D-aminopeptidase